MDAGDMGGGEEERGKETFHVIIAQEQVAQSDHEYRITGCGRNVPVVPLPHTVSLLHDCHTGDTRQQSVGLVHGPTNTSLLSLCKH